MKLRLDLPYFDLATRYSVSITTIQNIFLTYLHACYEIDCMCKIPSLEKNKASLPDSFGGVANRRFQIETPRKYLEAAGQAFSNYKHYLSAE